MNETGNNTPTPAASGTLSDRVRSLRLQDTSEPSGGVVSWIPWALCGVLLLVSGALAMEAFSPVTEDMFKKWAAENNYSSVSDGAPAKLSMPGSTGSGAPASEIALESKGYVVPFSLIQVSPKISGTVLKLYIEEGKEVNKDVVLAELEDIEYETDFRATAGRLEELRKYRDDEIRQTKADLEDSIAQLKQAKAKFIRTRDLQLRNAVAPEDFELAESAFQSLDARTVRLQLAFDMMKKGPRDEKIAAAQADYDKAKWRWDNTKVKAPIKGIILSKKTEEGNIVNPSAFSNGLSASLCEMADLLNMEVDLSIAERDLAKTFKDQECRIRAEAFPNRIYPGYVSRIMPTGDRSKGAVPVRVKIVFQPQDEKGNPLPRDQQGEYLRPEMGAIVTFLNRKKV